MRVSFPVFCWIGANAEYSGSSLKKGRLAGAGPSDGNHRQIEGVGKRAHHERLVPAAYFDLVTGGGAEIDAGAERHSLGDHELAGVGLGEAFDAARRVDGVADRGDRDCRAIAHLAYDGGP